jgi:hypothetical protein
MRHIEISHHREQILKIREQLGGVSAPLNDIKKPYMMETRVFDRRIARLIRHEAAYKAKFRAGLVKWFNKTY